MFFIVILFYLFLITIWVTMTTIEFLYDWNFPSEVHYDDTIKQNNMCIVSFNLQLSYNCLRIVAYFIFSIVELLLYFNIKNVLQKNLNLYYKQSKKNLALLTITSLIFQIGIICLDIFKMANDIGFYEIWWEENKADYLEKYLYLLYYVLIYLPFFFYIYYNMKNINFKLYLWQIMTGYRIARYYDSASIFVRYSWWTSLRNTCNSENNGSSVFGNSSINENREESMEASLSSVEQNLYKREFLTIKSKSKRLDFDYSLAEVFKKTVVNTE